MPLNDFVCHRCHHSFEELHKQDEIVLCPDCHQPTEQLIGCLADYTGQASKTVQYATRRSPFQDSHIHKLSSGDTSFLRNGIDKQITNTTRNK